MIIIQWQIILGQAEYITLIRGYGFLGMFIWILM